MAANDNSGHKNLFNPRSDDVPLLKPKPRQVPFGFNPSGAPIMIDQIKLAKDDDGLG